LKKHILPLLAALTLAACESPAPPAKRIVNVYTHRHYATDAELFAQFTQATGIEVQVVQAGDDELLARLEQEAANSPCDVLIAADAGRLGLATLRGLLRPTQSTTLQTRIPAHLREPGHHWFGLTMRARVVAYHKDRVKPEDIRTYADLTLPEWKGRVLVRSSENVYNQSLLAAMIAHQGAAAAEAWAAGIVQNLARPPQGGDTDQLMAVAEGIGDVAIVNSYYVGKLMASDEPEKQKAKAAIGVIFPTMDGHGTHVNVSGGGVTKHAPHAAEAMALLEFLSGPEAQERFAEGNKEYPVVANVAPAAELAAFGTFVADTLDLGVLAQHNAEAIKRFDAAGWR
jgi:iron(III) transport system substrate-binding protein